MVKIKSEEEIEAIRRACRILSEVMEKVAKEIRPGVTTNELDKLAESLILKAGGRCSFKGYQKYPACLCTSVNEEVVHAIPSGRTLKEGDIISLDLGVQYEGFHSDMAGTFPVGKISEESKKLIDVTERSLEEGIKKIKPGNKISDISKAVQKYVESHGLSVVRELCGHGIGRSVHEDPQILNYDDGEDGPELKEGMVICVEPMVAAGSWKVVPAKDGFGYKTSDNSLSAHFEHTIAVTKRGHEVLTRLK